MRRAGFSLIEVVLGLFFLASMLLVAGLATDRVMSSFRQRRAEQEVSASANRLLQRTATELSFAARTGLQPATLATVGAASVGYRLSLGLQGEDAVFGPMRSLAWEYERGELDDGLDNNENGLVDEGVVVWTESAGTPEERRTVLQHGVAEHLGGETSNGLDDNGNGLVDERGLSFVRDGDALVVRVSLQSATPGGVVTRTLETAVFARN